MKKVFETKLANGTLFVETGQLAKQADASVLLRYNETVLLITVVSKKLKEDRGFFPLIVNYEEKLYSVGKIPGNYNRRESRPADSATLTARLIDRPLRPLFPKGYNDEVQIVITVLSKEPDFEPDMISIFGSSLALLMAKNIPFMQPVSGVTVGMGDELIINPNLTTRETSSLNLKISGTIANINMVEAKALELSEEEILKAVDFGFKEIQKLNKFQEEIIKELSIEKTEFQYQEPEIKTELRKEIPTDIINEYKSKLKNVDRHLRSLEFSNIIEQYLLNNNIDENSIKFIYEIFDEIKQEEFIRLIVEDKYRVDGRSLSEIRSLSSEVNFLPRAHGSALFTRGETQSLTTITLGTSSDEQLFDGLEDYENKNFILHYNFPPYSVGETGRIGAPGRREIGHGNLAEKALSAVIPTSEEFPYTVRVVSEILESNGSSSQATICAGSLALMQAGVPIKRHVAGIAMGLIKKDDDYSILTDIQGLEDHLGDMDFKVAGTTKGITAIQMDIKIDGITMAILKDSLEQAKEGRYQLLSHLEETISSPNQTLSQYAPKIEIMKIEINQIREVIGKGGEIISKIIEETNVKIDIEDDGIVKIYGVNQEMIDLAKRKIAEIVKTYKKGEKYEGIVFRIEKYGAFIKFDDKAECLIHISDLSDKRVEKVEDVLDINQKIEFIITEIDQKKRIKGKLIFDEKN